jgi:predicted metalloprotease with PDZ domain
MMEDQPFEEFTFIYHFGMGGGGGMEHAYSTAIHAGSAENVAGVSAHEFFHLWNVKRIRPQTLDPVDYTRENWTRALWFAEGVTSTYGDFTLVRSGLWTRQQYYDSLAGAIGVLESRPARLWKSAEEASLDAWIESNGLYRRPDLSISYYNKGEILGVLLDILIRDATNNRRSLDDVMRHLNNEFARRGRFYDETRDLQVAVEKIANRSFADFFRDYVAGTEPLPYYDILSRAGLYLKQGEAPGADAGYLANGGPGGPIYIARVSPGSAAARAGLREGDVLVKLNDAEPPRDPNWARDRKPGEVVKLTIGRGGRQQEISFALEARRSTVFEIAEEANPSPKERRIREGMLTGKTDE